MIPSPTPKDVTVMIFLAFAWWLLLVGLDGAAVKTGYPINFVVSNEKASALL
jgi:hypothetical protein